MLFHETAKKIKSSRGTGILPTIAGIVIVYLMAVSGTKWYLSMTEGLESLNDELEIQTALDLYWSRINEASYDELLEAIDAKGTEWTEDVNGKYTITVKLGDDGKYESGGCSVGAAAGTTLKHCRNVTVSIAPNEEPGLVYERRVAKVSDISERQDIKDLESGINSSISRFSSYYTKAQVNSILAAYRTKAQTDAELAKGGGGGSPTTSGYYTYYSGAEDYSTTLSGPAYCICRMESDESKHIWVNGALIFVTEGAMAEPYYDNYSSYVGFLINNGGRVSYDVHAKDGGGHHTGSNIYGYCFPIK